MVGQQEQGLVGRLERVQVASAEDEHVARCDLDRSWLKYRQNFEDSIPPYYHAMTTGVVFAPGTTLRVEHDNAETEKIGLAGYIPGPDGHVPAVGTVGLAAMVVVLGFSD